MRFMFESSPPDRLRVPSFLTRAARAIRSASFVIGPSMFAMERETKSALETTVASLGI